jgi:hypothetical protein
MGGMASTDHILTTLNRHRVDYLLFGGLNFLLRHAPVLTYDIDIWIEDTPDNRSRCEAALAELQAEWGLSEDDWGPVATKRSDWLDYRGVFCLTSPHGAIDIFRTVAGLNSWTACRGRAEVVTTATGTKCLGLSDVDMLQCQLALPEGHRNEGRIQHLQEALRKDDHG